MRWCNGWVPLLVVVGLINGSCVTDVSARAYAGYFQSEVTGDFGLDNSQGTASLGAIKNNVESDLGIDDASSSFWVKAQVEPPELGRITVSGFTYDESSGGTLGQPFGDIPGGSAVRTELRFDNVKASWTYDLIDVGILHASPGVAVDVFAVDTRVSSTVPVAFEEVETVAFVPMIYGQAGLDLGVVALDVEAGWMSIDLGDANGSYGDFEAMLRASVAPAVELVAGYRYILLDGIGTADGQAFDADLRLEGWFVGGGVNF